MANKKKKDTKTIKSLGILILVVVAVSIGLYLGKSVAVSDINDENKNATNSIEQNNDVDQEQQVDKDSQQEQNNQEEPIKDHEEVSDNQEEVNDNQEQIIDDQKEQIKDQEEATEIDETETNTSQEVSSQQDEKDTTEQVEVSQGSNEETVIDMNIDTSSLSNTGYGWCFKRNTEHKQTQAYNKFDINQYGAYYIATTDEKVIYLTFDEGYEKGYSSRILDTLKANDVKATFFVTKPYIEENAELCKRMKVEGHIVGNHTVNHKKMHELSDDKIKYEIEETGRYFEEVTGYKMDSFLRPPAGEYSERSLYLTAKAGYKTIFWSMAYADWYTDKQPGKEYAYNHVINNAHPGMIALLHAVSSSNTEALDDIIKTLKEQGYRFGNLYEIQ